jgi:hypothetical protein
LGDADVGVGAQDQIVVRVDPVAGSKFVKQRAIEAARGPVIDVLDNGVVAQPGIAQSGGQAFVAAVSNLPRVLNALRKANEPLPAYEIALPFMGVSRTYDG